MGRSQLALWALAVPVAWMATSDIGEACDVPLLASVAGLLGILLCAASARVPTHLARWLGVAGLACLSVLPVARALVVPGLPFTHDLSVHAWALWSTARAMLAGELRPLWFDTVGLGSPAPQFYPPVPYLLGGGLVAAGLDVPTAIVALGWLSGALGMATTAVVLADRGLSGPAVLLGCVAFLLAPYRLYDVGYRFALGEMLGLALVLPFWHLCVRVARGEPGALLTRPARWLAGVAALLVLTHPLSLVTAVWGGLPLAIALGRAAPGARSLAAAAVVALGLSAFQTVPSAVDLPSTRVHVVLPSGPNGYQARALHPLQPLVREAWHGRRLSLTLAQEERRDRAGESYVEPPFYLGWVLCVPALLGLASRDPLARAVGAAGLWSWAATWPSVSWAMGHVSVFHPLQFPWRFLGPASLAGVWGLALFVSRSGVARGPLFVGLATAALVWDARPASGAGSWVDWPEAAFVATPQVRPAPTCDPDADVWGAEAVPVDLAAARPPAPPASVGPATEGPAWAGRATGDLPVRVVGGLLPPRDPRVEVAGVYPVPAEFWTEATAAAFRKPIEGRDAAAMERAGVALVLPGSRGAQVRAVADWPRVQLVWEGGRHGVRATVRRPRPSHVVIDLPPAMPAGTLVLVEQAFPGWSARVDGEAVEVGAVDGLLAVPVPPGAAQVELALGATPARWAGRLVTLATLLLVAWAWRRP